MKLILTTFIALIGLVAADVSHLNREYLPPVQHYSGDVAEASVPAKEVTHVHSEPQAVEAAAPAEENAVSYGSYEGGAADANQLNRKYLPPVEHYTGNVAEASVPEAAPAEGGAHVHLEPQTVEAAAPADDGVISYGSYGSFDSGEHAQLQYQVGGVVENKLDIRYDGAQGGAAAQVEGVEQAASYDFGSQDAVVDYSHNVAPAEVSQAAAAPSAHSAFDTQYASNGGYIY